MIKGRISHRMKRHQMIIVQDNSGQHIVEIMGDPTGQLPDRLHLFALRQTGFQRLLLADINDIGNRRLTPLIKRHEHIHMGLIRIRQFQPDRLINRVHQSRPENILAVLREEQVNEAGSRRRVPAGQIHQGPIGVRDNRALQRTSLNPGGPEGRVIEHRIPIRPGWPAR